MRKRANSLSLPSLLCLQYQITAPPPAQARSQADPESENEFEGDEWDLYKIGVDGSNSVNLTPDEGNWSNPALSPDGSKILYAGETSLAENEYVINLYTMKIDGSANTLYPNPISPHHGLRAIKWHPAGKQASFASTAN